MPAHFDINDAEGGLVVSLATEEIQGPLNAAERAAAIWRAAAAIAERTGLIPRVQATGSMFLPGDVGDLAWEVVVSLEEGGFVACYHDA